MMKKILFILSFLLSANVIFAQKELIEGSLSYTYTVDTKVKIEFFEALKDTKMTIYFSKDKQKMAINMGIDSKMQVFLNPKDGSTRWFNDVMEEKIEMIGADSLYKYELAHRKTDPELKKTPMPTGKTKDILGFKCEEYSFREIIDGIDTKFNWYFTKELAIDKSFWTNDMSRNLIAPMMPIDSKIEGYPMEMSMVSSLDSIILSVSNIQEKVEKEVFEIPEGYKKEHISTLIDKEDGF